MRDARRSNRQLLEQFALYREQAERTLDENVARYTSLFEHNPDAIYSFDLNGYFTSANDTATRFSGYSAQDLLGKTFENLIAPEDLEKTRQHFLKAREGKLQNYETKIIRKDGDVVLLNVTNVPIIIRKKVTGVYGIAQDITARKQAEEVLRQSEEKYRSLASSTDSMYLVDRECRYQFMNHIHLSRFGVSLNEIVGRSYGEFHSDEDTKEFAGDVERIVETGKSFQHEHRSSRDNRYFLRTFSPVIDEGKTIVAVSVISKDITKHKQAEEEIKEAHRRLDDIIQFLPDATLVIDRKGKVIAWNRAIEAMTGIKAGDMLGKGNYEYALPFYGERRPILIDMALRADPEREKQYTAIRRTGDILFGEAFTPNLAPGNVHLSATASVLRNSGGNIIAAIECIRNNTERKKLEAQLQQAQKMEAVGTLAGGIAHDFNNILMAIQGNISLMIMNTNPSDPRYEKLSAIEDQVVMGANLTKQLLGFARIGKYELKPIDLNEVIEKSSTMFGRTKKEIMIHRNYEQALWAVEADTSQMEQILMNLYVNAHQAMPGGGHLYLETANLTITEVKVKNPYMKPGKYVKVSVTDTGVGMDERTRERIFEPFFTTKEMGRGTGLGLAMVYGIVKGHKGYINVYSEIGKGTIFSIYLPASEKDASKDEKPVEVILRGKENILLVDDEGTIIAVIKEILEALGYHVLTAGNGREALEIYEKNKDKIDLVILDMIMPDMSGGETFDHLKEINQDIKVILSSGYSLNSEAAVVMIRGCQGFIQKPTSVAELSRKIREVLGNKAQAKFLNYSMAMG